MLGFGSVDKFQALFEKHIELAVAASGQLHLAFSDAEKARAAQDLVLHYEHLGDELTRQGHEFLSETFITKLDKGDIEAMFKNLDDILDSMESAVFRMRSYAVKDPIAHSTEIVEIIGKMTSELQVMVENIPELSSRRAGEIVGILKAQEREADVLRWQCIEEMAKRVSSLIEYGDALKVAVAQNDRHIWEQIIAKLEQTTNHCFHLAVTIAGVVRKEGR
ncbi:MAG: DUF47 family protein [Candidatus Niyogibacteria bacterium]|nr:DUF47 family protein [Candidatus Niyogibacteria bacterium]